MVTVQLKHVHVVRAKLASGKVAEYHYAWKGAGAPRLKGSPGSPEYVTAYQEAHASRKQPITGTLRELVCAYRAAPEFARLSVSSTRAYSTYLDLIETKFGTLPLDALNDPRAARLFWKWRDDMAETPRKADYAVGTLKVVLSWAHKRSRLTLNVAEKIERLHRADKSDAIWTADDFTAFARAASTELNNAVRLAAFTGLRQGDLCRLAWTHRQGDSFRLRTSKRGRQVIVPIVPDCAALLGSIPRLGPVVLTTERGKRPWTPDGLRSSFRKACIAAGVNRTFHDLRRTAATKMLRAGCDAGQVAMAMAWSEEAVEEMKRTYVSRGAVVEAMVAKLTAGR